MGWFEHGKFVTYVARATETKSANHLSGEIADYVAKHICGDKHSVAFGVLEKPHADRINIGVVHLDAGEIFRHPLAGLQKHPFSGTHHIRLVNHGDFRIAEFFSVLEGGTDDPLTTDLTVDLARDGIVVVWHLRKMGERLAEFRQCCNQFFWNRGELNSGV